MLLPGPSIYRLEKNILALDNGDICFATVNDFWIFEEKILSQIERRFDVILASADECGIPNETHMEYLDREDNNIFLSTKKAWGDKIPKTEKLLFFETDPQPLVRPIPTGEEPLTFRPLASFALMLFILTIAGAREIYLFGADGGNSLNGKLYYEGWPSQSWGRLIMDTRILNENFSLIMERICKLYRIDPPNIFNVSYNSAYTCFRAIEYESAFNNLR